MLLPLRKLLLPSLIALLTLLAGVAIVFQTAPNQKTVRVFYLIPQDRAVRPEYEVAIEFCVRELQSWYAKQLDGKTFRLNDPVVEVVRTKHDATWYNTHVPPNKPEKIAYTFYNAVREAAVLDSDDENLAAYIWPHADPDSVWLIYIDAPGGSGAGVHRAAVLPDHDLAGLTGNASDGTPLRRWVGGSGHELGHAFHLMHSGEAHAGALMQRGYATYPDCYLTDEDKAILNASPFLQSQRPAAWKLVLLATIVLLLAVWLRLRQLAKPKNTVL